MANKTAGTDYSTFTQSETVKITIDNGDKPETFNLFIDLLKARSPYLARKIDMASAVSRSADGSFVINDDNDNNNNIEVRLHSVRLAPFSQFVQWIFNEPLTTAVSSPSLLIASYLLAHRFECVNMRNDILDALCQYHLANPKAPIGLSHMVKLAAAMPPDVESNGSKNMLLKFMVHQLTYKIFTSGWDTYRHNKDLQILLQDNLRAVYWHLDALHDMQKSTCPASSLVEVDVKPDPDAYMVGNRGNRGNEGNGDDDDEMEGIMTTSSIRKQLKVKRSKGGWVPNPAVKGLESCCYHEHPSGGGEAKCFQVVDLSDDVEP